MPGALGDNRKKMAVSIGKTYIAGLFDCNVVDGCRNSEGMAASMLYLSGQGWWSEGERFTMVCTGTLVYRTRVWDWGKRRLAASGATGARRGADACQ